MSDYWDAVARAALDLPAAATPRPHSRFEPDVSELGAAPIEVAEEGSDAPRTTPGRRTESTLGGPAETSRGPIRAAAAQSVEVDPIEPAPAGIQPDTSTASDRDPRTTPSTGPAAESPSPAAAPPPVTTEVHHVDRVEVHRVERTQTVIETGARPITDVREPVASGLDQPVAASPSEPARPLGVPVTHESATPMVAVAEPLLPPPPQLDRAMAPGPAPLVIEIDRIDIRIEPETIAPRPVAATTRRTEAAVPSLGDYLARRSEGRA